MAQLRALLAFALVALAMQAIVPAGLMVAPSAAHGAQIILCTQTHLLARAAAAQAIEAAAAVDAMAAVHVAMGHAPQGHATIDHAAMGHGPAPDDPAPEPSTAANGQSCAVAGAGALAALLPEPAVAFAALPILLSRPPLPGQPLGLIEQARLRPPLRAPPALI
ncbi:hypothetical protein [Sandarakinorhabdus sp.]|uniref:hypothetical protein n=1 Tax=Sandarakinorhabdus sp. TaxID=1916663 RepID=UPI003F70811B